MSWRHPATHWTYWELCDRKEEESYWKTAARLVCAIQKNNKTSLEGRRQWVASETQSRRNMWKQASPKLAWLSLINPPIPTPLPPWSGVLRMHAENSTHQTHARSQRSSSTLPLHLSRDWRVREAERRKHSVNFREAEEEQESSRTKRNTQTGSGERRAEESRLPGWKCKEMMFGY